MTVRLTRLRIAGFKSFAEPVVLNFADGLTGIVGPNGCGKSNVVDALRWVMGESSARSMRGGEMDDVIFAGTAHRPSRNLAEVTLTLEPGDRPAPSPWQDAAEIEISRKITRGGGSVFRVNGRETRARDVGTLLADLGSGADSAALVGQGRVAALIAAKPADRRAVLEEAAGITGLAARRHEAEMKLRAADANLLRSDDTLAQLRDRAAALTGQAEAAAKYRTLGDAIRAAEAEVLTVTKILAVRAVAAGEAALAAAKTASADAAIRATHATAALADATAALPACEAAETAARDATGAAKTDLAVIAAEAAQAEAASHAARALAADLANDLAAAERAVRDADTALARLDAELETLAAAHAPDEIAHAQTRAAGTVVAARAADAHATAATEAAAAAAAHRQAADAVLATADRRHADAHRTQAAAAAALAQAVRDTPPAHAVGHAHAARDAADVALAAARETADAADAEREAAMEALAPAQADATQAAAARAQLLAEHAALVAALTPPRNAPGHTPIADRLVVPPGLEAAVSGAMGLTLDAGTDDAAAAYWSLPPPEGLTGGAEPGRDLRGAIPAAATLDTLVAAPPELRRALAYIVLVDATDDDEVLPPGWTAVCRDGRARRWDGYVVRPGAAPAVALRLTQRNRLRAVEAARPGTDGAHAAAQAALDVAKTREAAAHRARADARHILAGADGAARAAQSAWTRLQDAAAAAQGRLAAANDREAAAAASLADAAASREAARGAAAGLPDLSSLRAAQTEARARLDAARLAEQEASRRVAGLIRAAEERNRRRTAATAERAGWAVRRAAAAAQAGQLAGRAASAAREAEAAARAPEAIAVRLAAAQSTAADSAAHAAACGAALRRAQDCAADAAQGARAADRAAEAAREALSRAIETLAAAHDAAEAAAARIAERLGLAPLPDVPDPSPDAAARAQRRHDRLVREREALGPVNLLAETELAETSARAGAMQAEAAELTTAIAKLRGSIGYLNREGRERLTAVFSDVDRHFQALFGRLFQGGRAHLALTGSDDPLSAGLEIFVQPPGKKLATLSLLSGGEQALTALCLIFAIFRCNPAPVCVLDEVDAPLDDANVDRFCTLIADLARETATRFLVVTHHPQTMARTDRLFGVTMQERGVSRLLSVDLGTATRMVETPKLAAE